MELKPGDEIIVYNEPDSKGLFLREFVKMEEHFFMCKSPSGRISPWKYAGRLELINEAEKT